MGKTRDRTPFENLRRAVRQLQFDIDALRDGAERERLLNLSRPEFVAVIHVEHDANPILAVVGPPSDAHAAQSKTPSAPAQFEDLGLDEIDRKLVEEH